ncbi:MAG: hypothetical protein ACLP4V_34345 [Methylocella sp.]
MQRPTQIDIDLVDAVNAYLKQLLPLAVFNANKASLASGSLRSLLVQDMLAQAWRALGERGSMTFRTWCIAKGRVTTSYADVLRSSGTFMVA